LCKQDFKKNIGVQLQQEPVIKPEVIEEKPRESVSAEVQQQRLADWLKSIEQAPEPKRIARKVHGLTYEEIQEEGQERPKRPIYHRDDGYVNEYKNRVRENQIKTVRERHPELTEEEVIEYVEKNLPVKFEVRKTIN
jgi:hypothetical protein